MEEIVDQLQNGKIMPLSRAECGDIYQRYFLNKEPMASIAADMERTRLTISRCIHAQQKALHAIRPDLGSGRPKAKIHYARYQQQVIEFTCDQPRRRKKEEHSTRAEQFILDWWQRQQRESKRRRWMDAKTLFEKYYCVAVPDPTARVSYKTFTRALQRIVGEAYHPTPGRPKQRPQRGRPKSTGQGHSLVPSKIVHRSNA